MWCMTRDVLFLKICIGGVCVTDKEGDYNTVKMLHNKKTDARLLCPLYLFFFGMTSTMTSCDFFSSLYIGHKFGYNINNIQIFRFVSAI